MDQSNELQRCIIMLCPNVASHKRVTEKALELCRKMTTWVPLGALGKAKSCKHLVAIELACRSLNVLFNRDKLQDLSRVGSKDFQQAVNNSRSLLKLTFTKTEAIDILAVQAGVEYKKPALELLEEYRRNYVDKLDKSRQALIILESAEYQAAAFLVVSGSKKAAERNRVCDLCDVSTKLVQNIMDDLERMRTRASKGKGRDAEAEAEASTGVVQKPKRLSKGQSQQRALKASSHLQPDRGLNDLVGPEALKRSRLDLENTAGNESAASKMTLDSSEPLLSVLNRLTSHTSTGVSAFADERGIKKQSAHEAARALEAEKSRRAVEERQREAVKKRARYENWKQDVLRKRKTT